MKYALLAPAVVLCMVFTLWPLVEVVRLSLVRTNFITTQWVGLSNYVQILKDAAFLRSVANSGLYVVLLIGFTVIGAVTIALTALWLPKLWHDAARFVFYIPALSAGIIIAGVWRWIFHLHGPINWLLGLVGIPAVSWFAAWWTGIPVVALVVSMTGMGGGVIILLAAILSINRELFDAARIDGATSMQIKFRIVLPMIMPTVWLLILMAAIAAPQIFETIYALAPYDYTATMAFFIYRQAFQMSRYGMASAQAMVLLVLTVGLVWAKQRITREA